ncbi:MAG: EAL domain-containing protein [Clostridia bacterium]|nr:EAL domain-containing protein [Clostridia bacterium]
MRNYLFDLCSIPIYMLILWTCYARKIYKDQASRIFITMNAVSLLCAVLNVAMEFAVNPVPISRTAVFWGSLTNYLYLFFRNGTLVLYLLFVFAITRTEFRIRSPLMRCLLWAPNGVLVLLLLQNLFTHTVFNVTTAEGYTRGPLMIALYIIAGIYGLSAAGYSFAVREYLPAEKWAALISVFVLTVIAVIVQMIKPYYQVELFSTSIGSLMIMLLVMRPEESIDASVNISSWKAYRDDLRNIVRSGQRVQIVVVRMGNADEIRSYIGENKFNDFVKEVADEIEGLYNRLHVRISLYFERPGTFYLILDDMGVDVPALVPDFVDATTERVKRYADQGVRFDPKFCVIHVPDDMNTFEDIINMGHRFKRLGAHDQVLFVASGLVGSRDYRIISHIDGILNRIITENTLEMVYQPIFDIRENRFRSAEALARIRDTEYGTISPAVFIPAAESAGLMWPIGKIILETVYRFISRHDLESLGLSYIEINLSMAQCLQRELPETIRRLQDKYGVSPSQVNFEVTETMFGNLSGVMEKNLRELAAMGYTFSLDDYGVGYSNIQRLKSLPLSLIKVDKSLVDDMFSEDGKVIIENTVHMMQGIHKKLVVEGVETKEAVDALSSLDCDYIQGYYYSRPLSAGDFVRFMQARNRTGA